MLKLSTHAHTERIPLTRVWQAFGRYEVNDSTCSELVIEDILQATRTGMLDMRTAHSQAFQRLFSVPVEVYGKDYVRVGYHFIKLSLTYVVLKCTDKELTATGGIIPRFQYIKDFVEAYPGVPIPVPYTNEQVVEALEPYRGRRTNLRGCYEVVNFLNPLRNTYYLEFDLTGMTGDDLRLIASRFTEQERLTLQCMNLVAKRTYPNAGQGHCVLAGHITDYPSLCEELFSDYPSWLFMYLADRELVTSALMRGDVSPVVNGKSLKLLLTADFTDVAAVQTQNTAQLCRYIVNYIMLVLAAAELSWPQVARLLAMLNIRNTDLMNEDLEVQPPHGLPVGNFLVSIRDEARQKIVEAYPGEWNDAFLSK